MKHIAMCSFGKDSMAMLYIMKKYNLPIDMIVYVRIMFDKDTPAEIPEHEKWIEEYAIPKIKKDFGLDVIVLESDKNYVDLFNTEITRGSRKGQNRGFPLLFGSWCHRDLKIAPAKKFLKQFGKYYVQYLGIACDEQSRIGWEISQGNKLPLVDYNITEEEARQICIENNVLSPAYEKFNRLGCWFCHKQGNMALTKVINSYPNLWKKICALDWKSKIKFKQKLSASEITKKLNEKEMKNKTIIKLNKLFANGEQYVYFKQPTKIKENSMSITDRFKKLFPNADVYWNWNINQLSLHFIKEKIDVEQVKVQVYRELSSAGLLNAVESVRILNY